MDKGEVEEVELEDAPPAVALAALMTIPVPRRAVSTRPESAIGVGVGCGLTPSDSLAIKSGRVGRLGRLAIGSSDLQTRGQLLPVCVSICESCSR